MGPNSSWPASVLFAAAWLCPLHPLKGVGASMMFFNVKTRLILDLNDNLADHTSQ
jgi:hypothetical protein